MEREYIAGIPSGLMAAMVDGREERIEGASPRSLVLGIPCFPVGSRVTMAFYVPETGRYREVAFSPDGWEERGNAVALRVSDPAYCREERRIAAEWGRYIASFPPEGAEGDIPGGISDAFSGFLSGAAWGRDLRGRAELALALDTPERRQAFLCLRAEEYLLRELDRYFLAGHEIGRLPVGRIYIGSDLSDCQSPAAPEIARLAERGRERGLSVTLALPPLTESGIKRAREALRVRGINEVTVNDWGALRLAAEEGVPASLGRLLSRRKKDPRMGQKPGHSPAEAAGSPEMEAYLQRYGVVRAEEDAAGYDFVFRAKKTSLHFPFYPMAVSETCPLRAACETGRRGRQRQGADCPGYCRENAFLYPGSAGMIGRYNAIYGFDSRPLRDTAWLEKCLEQGVDRVVLELP